MEMLTQLHVGFMSVDRVVTKVASAIIPYLANVSVVSRFPGNISGKQVDPSACHDR
jgi:hypothetical protein